MRFLLTLFFLFIIIIADAQPVREQLMWQGRGRNLLIYTPANYSADEHLPLVINMHPFVGNGSGQMFYTNYNRLADTARCIVVYPDGIQGRWNSGDFMGIPNYVDDVGFINLIIDYMSLLYNIDSRRVYATGYSAGGFMSYRLACELTNRITAIAPVAASMNPSTYETCNPDRPVPVLAINSIDDPITIYNGFTSVQPVDDVMALWQELNGCDIVPQAENIPDINTSDNATADLIRYSNCDGSGDLFLLKQFNAGHTWPGARPFALLGNTLQDWNATNETWAFFKQYEIPDEVACDRPVQLQSEQDENVVTLSWEAIPGIDNYNILVITPGGQFIYEEGLADNSYQLDVADEGSLIWTVRAECTSGHVSWAELRQDEISFRIAAGDDRILTYPNPATSVIRLMLPENMNGFSVSIINTMGRIAAGFDDVSSNTELDISALPKGLYQAVATGPGNFISSFRIY